MKQRRQDEEKLEIEKLMKEELVDWTLGVEFIRIRPYFETGSGSNLILKTRSGSSTLDWYYIFIFFCCLTDILQSFQI